MVADTVRMVSVWRAEAPEQWPEDRRELDEEKLQEVLEKWGNFGLEPRLLLYLVLGTEWLFRARKAAPADIEAEISKIEARLFNVADPILWPGQEPAFEAIAAKLRKLMASERYLISLGGFSFADKLWFLRAGAKVNRMPRIALVARKAGPIPRVGPKFAAVMVDGLVQQVEPRRNRRESVVLPLADLLLLPPESPDHYRAFGTTRPELSGWVRLMDRPIEDPYPEGPEEEPRNTFRRWLLFRLKRYIASQQVIQSWEHLLAEIARDPVWAFSPIAERTDVARLYALPWG